MKIYVVSQGNEEFHRISHVDSDWNRAVKHAVEELRVDDVELRNNKRDREGVVAWEFWSGATLTRISQLELS